MPPLDPRPNIKESALFIQHLLDVRLGAARVRNDFAQWLRARVPAACRWTGALLRRFRNTWHDIDFILLTRQIWLASCTILLRAAYVEPTLSIFVLVHVSLLSHVVVSPYSARDLFLPHHCVSRGRKARLSESWMVGFTLPLSWHALLLDMVSNITTTCWVDQRRIIAAMKSNDNFWCLCVTSHRSLILGVPNLSEAVAPQVKTRGGLMEFGSVLVVNSGSSLQS